MNKKELAGFRNEISEIYFKKCQDSIYFMDIVFIGTLIFFCYFSDKWLLFINAFIYLTAEFFRLKNYVNEYSRYKTTFIEKW